MEYENVRVIKNPVIYLNLCKMRDKNTDSQGVRIATRKDIERTEEIEDIINEVHSIKLDNYFEFSDIFPDSKNRSKELKSLDKMVECPICKNKSIIKYNYAFGDKGEVFYYCVKCEDFVRLFGDNGLKVERYTKCEVCSHNDLDNANVTMPITNKLDINAPVFKYCRNCRKFIKQ